MFSLPNAKEKITYEYFAQELDDCGIRGKCSFFGGPEDHDGGRENLVLPIRWPEVAEHNYTPKDLDTTTPYCAMCWELWDNFRRDPEQKTYNYGLVKDYLILILANGQIEMAFPVDHGPSTNRLIDLSPYFANKMGLNTDDKVDLLLYYRLEQRVMAWERSKINLPHLNLFEKANGGE